MSALYERSKIAEGWAISESGQCHSTLPLPNWQHGGKSTVREDGDCQRRGIASYPITAHRRCCSQGLHALKSLYHVPCVFSVIYRGSLAQPSPFPSTLKTGSAPVLFPPSLPQPQDSTLLLGRSPSSNPPFENGTVIMPTLSKTCALLARGWLDAVISNSFRVVCCKP